MQIKVPNEYKYPSRGRSLDAHAHNVKRTLHLTIERRPDGSTSPFKMFLCERVYTMVFEQVDVNVTVKTKTKVLLCTPSYYCTFSSLKSTP